MVVYKECERGATGTQLSQILYKFALDSFTNGHFKLWPVAGPVIQANGRMTFEYDLKSGGLLYFTTCTVNQHLHKSCQQYGHSGGT